MLLTETRRPVAFSWLCDTLTKLCRSAKNRWSCRNRPLKLRESDTEETPDGVAAAEVVVDVVAGWVGAAPDEEPPLFSVVMVTPSRLAVLSSVLRMLGIAMS